MDNQALIIQIITIVLLGWSEYLGLSPTQKCNAITQVLLCALGQNITPNVTPASGSSSTPAVVSTPSVNTPLTTPH